MPKKSLGQNFLNDENILSKIVECGDLSNDDFVIEIGPGTGNLTEKILNKNPKHLIVIEKDIDLSKKLKNKFGERVEVINKDILECYNDFNFGKPLKVFGNLPYNISTKILISFLKIENLNNLFDKFIFVFQKEVADRILAKENSRNYGRLTILTAWKMTRSKIIDINPVCFYPKPKVWSSLLTLVPKLKIEQIKEAKSLEHITNIFFNQRRKKIRKPMKQLFSNFEIISKKVDLDLNLRPQNISESKYFELCKIYEDLIQ